MKYFFTALTIFFLSSSAYAGVQTRCGWIWNPTPANYWLNDADGEWLIAKQGGYQAEGAIEAYPTDEQKVNTNGHYGYWCGCVVGEFDKKKEQVTKIISSSVKNLDACLEDPRLP
jgi:hypothetical protein